MKGLMFTLLDQMARRAGCSDEAWELVMEFAAAETLIDDQRSAHESAGLDAMCLDLFDVPTEAMLNCLCRERTGLGPHFWDEPAPPTPRQPDSARAAEVACDAFRRPFTASQQPFGASRTGPESKEADEDLLDERLETEWNRYPLPSEPPGPKGR